MDIERGGAWPKEPGVARSGRHRSQRWLLWRSGRWRFRSPPLRRRIFVSCAIGRIDNAAADKEMNPPIQHVSL